jgi:hypothetical protein
MSDQPKLDKSYHSSRKLNNWWVQFSMMISGILFKRWTIIMLNTFWLEGKIKTTEQLCNKLLF